MKQIQSVVTRSGLLFITLDVILKFRGGPEVFVTAMATIVQNRNDKWVFEEIDVQSFDEFKLNGVLMSDDMREQYLRAMRSVGVDYFNKIERAVSRHCRRMGVERLAATAGINITNPVIIKTIPEKWYLHGGDLLDKSGVTRPKLSGNVADSGYYKNEDGEWQYDNVNFLINRGYKEVSIEYYNNNFKS